MEWYLAVLKKYAQFDGRARRKEFWMFVLFNLIIAIALGILGSIIHLLAFLSPLYSLAVLIPGIAVGARRLHDTGRTGWWLLIGFIPVVGAIVLIVFGVQDSQPGSNEYGPNPKESA